MQDPLGTVPPRAVKTSLSLLCAELRGDPEPQKKRSKLAAGSFSSLQGSPVSPTGSGGCVLPPTPPESPQCGFSAPVW